MPDKKTWIERVVPVLLIVVVVMAFGMGAMWSRLQTLEKGVVQGTTVQPQQPTQAAAAVKPTVSLDSIKSLFDGKHIEFGDKNSKLLLVEVADPSCPYCHVAAGHNSDLNRQMGSQFVLVQDGGSYVAPVPEMKKLVDQNKAAFIWLYTPGHGNGEMGTKALYCAYEMGKFWQAHDKLMSNEGYNLLNNVVKNDKTKLADLAKFLSGVIDANKLKSCIDSGKYDARLGEEPQIASSLGVNGTPGFFVNATNFAGAYSWTDMKSAVDAALK